jgi:hypothetical protein
MARARLLDVPGHESRQAGARPAVRLDLEPQFRRPSGLQGSHASGFARDGGGGGDRRPLRRCAELSLSPTDPRAPGVRPDVDPRAEEARRILGQVEAESPGVFGSALKQAGDHFAGRDARGEGVQNDAIEVWGRRIGRGLGAIFFVVLIVNLFTRWFF